MLVAERAHLLAIDLDEAKHRIVLPQSHDYGATRTTEVDQRAAIGFARLVSRLGFQIIRANQALARQDAGRGRARAVNGWIAAAIFGKRRRHAASRSGVETLADMCRKLPEGRTAERQG